MFVDDCVRAQLLVADMTSTFLIKHELCELTARERAARLRSCSGARYGKGVRLCCSGGPCHLRVLADMSVESVDGSSADVLTDVREGPGVAILGFCAAAADRAEAGAG